MKNNKTKKSGIFIAVGIVGIMLASGMSSVSACHIYSPLLASNDEIDIGTVEVIHNTVYDNIATIIYTIDESDWTMSETHLAVGATLDDIPQTKSGNPKIGRFPYHADHPEGTVTYTYTIDLGDYGLFNPNNNQYRGTLFFAAHAVVSHPTLGEETAWGDTGQSFPGNSWALYFTVTF